MIVTGLDLEATGLDKVNDRPIEVGLTLWTTNYQRSLETANFLVDSDVKVSEEITEITGVRQSMVDRFSYGVDSAYDKIEYFVSRSEAIVAFNGRRFDIPMMQAWAKRLGRTFPDMPIIDPYEDMPATSKAAYPGMRPQELITMCAKEGIYYDAHEAGADVGGMLKLMSKRPFEFVWERSQSPTIIVQSHQNRYENAKVKKHRFRWNPDRKIWWKAVKQIDLDHLAKQVNNEFSMEERTDLTPEMLDSSDSQ